jgi:hypothetical protein
LTELRDSQAKAIKQKRFRKRAFPEVGEIVIIEHELLPRNQWKLGKVTELILSADGEIRTVKLKTESRQSLQKPINKIVPLEIRTVAKHAASTGIPQNNNVEESNCAVNSNDNLPSFPRHSLNRISKTYAKSAIHRLAEEDINSNFTVALKDDIEGAASYCSIRADEVRAITNQCNFAVEPIYGKEKEVTVLPNVQGHLTVIPHCLTRLAQATRTPFMDQPLNNFNDMEEELLHDPNAAVLESIRHEVHTLSDGVEASRAADAQFRNEVIGSLNDIHRKISELIDLSRGALVFRGGCPLCPGAPDEHILTKCPTFKNPIEVTLRAIELSEWFENFVTNLKINNSLKEKIMEYLVYLKAYLNRKISDLCRNCIVRAEAGHVCRVKCVKCGEGHSSVVCQQPSPIQGKRPRRN